MEYKEALKEIAKEYPIDENSKTYSQIDTDILFDEDNYIFIGVLSRENKTLLVDYAEYAQLVDYDKYEKQIKELANKYHISINDYHIEKEYSSYEDIKEFTKFLLKLRVFLK